MNKYQLTNAALNAGMGLSANGAPVFLSAAREVQAHMRVSKRQRAARPARTDQGGAPAKQSLAAWFKNLVRSPVRATAD